jgi:hypothetical protein
MNGYKAIRTSGVIEDAAKSILTFTKGTKAAQVATLGFGQS